MFNGGWAFEALNRCVPRHTTGLANDINLKLMALKNYLEEEKHPLYLASRPRHLPY